MYLKVVAILAVTLLFSCRDEEIIRHAGNGKDMCFIVRTQDEQVITTRTANDDNALSDVYALLFTGSDDDSRLVTMATATTTNTDPNASVRIYFANITEENSQGARSFCILANVASIINSYQAQWNNEKPTLKEVREALISKLGTRSAPNNNQIVNDPKFAPMASTLQVFNQITTDNYEVTLVRATAKVTVTDNSANTHYSLQGASLGNVAKEGFVFAETNKATKPQEVGIYVGKEGDTYSLDYMMRDIAEGTKATEPLYAFETYADGKPFVLIKGEYDGVTGYHRINLYQDKSKKEYYDITHNCHYQVVINKIYTTGYKTAQEAIDSGGSGVNEVNVDITVSDGTSNDIISNGEYYLGLSNSEYWYYGDWEKELDIATIQTDAPAGVLKEVTLRIVEGGSHDQIMLVKNPFTDPDHNLSVKFPLTVLKAEAVVRVGNLTRKIMIHRGTGKMAFGGSYELDDDFVFGKVVSQNTEEQWIGFSNAKATADDDSGNKEYISNGSGKQALYMLMKSNIKMDPTTSNVVKESTLMLSKANDEGHTKIYVCQETYDIFNKNESSEAKIENPYVGAFWRYNQTGERVIKMTLTGGGSTELTWEAVVAVGSDWILLQKGASPDPNIYGPEGGKSLPGDAENFQLTNGKDYINGDGTELIFRIGLKDKLPNIDDHRYGLIIVNTYLNGVAKNHYRIFVRQGDAPDYLFRNSDGGYNNWSGTRDKAIQLSAYNLTDPKLGKGTSGNFTSHNVMQLDYYNNSDPTFHRNEFTEFPSQAGYFYVWNVAPGQTIKNPSLKALNPSLPSSENYMRAFHPIFCTGMTSTLFSLELREPNIPGDDKFYRDVTTLEYTPEGDPCPYGYRYPSVGEKITSGGKVFTETSVSYSETMQSLAFNPTITDQSTMSDYTLWGYYADGFFDRLTINTTSLSLNRGLTPISKDNLVAKGQSEDMLTRINNSSGNDIGYAGMLIFNPYNYSSIFFPATGRIATNHVGPGSIFFTWASNRTLYEKDNGNCYPMDWSGSKTAFNIISGQGDLGQLRAVRCVRDKNISVNWDSEPVYEP